jgi:acyl carrier protein
VAGLLVLGAAFYSAFPGATAMGAETIVERVKRIISEHLGVDAAKVTLESDLVRDLKADCLDMVELVMAFEEEFKKPFSDDVSDALVTVGDAAGFIESGKIPPAKPPGSPSCMPARSGQK